MELDSTKQEDGASTRSEQSPLSLVKFIHIILYRKGYSAMCDDEPASAVIPALSMPNLTADSTDSVFKETALPLASTVADGSMTGPTADMKTTLQLRRIGSLCHRVPRRILEPRIYEGAPSV